MIDTGARYSTLNTPLPLSQNTVPVVGFSGNTEEWPLSKPVSCLWNSLAFEHSFLLSPSCPVNLLARDIMCSQNISVLMTPEYVDITFQDGSAQRCATPKQAIRQLVQTTAGSPDSGSEGGAEIWWGLIPDFLSTPLHATFSSWLPWISVIRLHTNPVDPPHCTYYYELYGDENYDALWNGFVQQYLETGEEPCVEIRDIYVGPEGVAAAVSLPASMEILYALSDTSPPYITLQVTNGGEAKNLGPMVKRCLMAGDWSPTQNKNLRYSPSTQTYMITHVSHTTLHPEKRHLSRTHGRENTDHPHTQALLDSLPDTLWSAGPTDVGLLNIPPISIPLKHNIVPIYRAPYPLKPDQVMGIRNTIKGFVNTGVLTPTISLWNTPINPVPKLGKPDYRMIHDLRPINKIIITTNYDTPNPYTMLNGISPDQHFFSCIDLANAFFSVPLHEDSQQMFAFSYEGTQYTYTRLPQGFIDAPSIFNHVLKKQLQSLTLPQGVSLLQYVDDILLAAPDSDSIMTATEIVLTHLAECGFKVSKTKLQIGRPKVTFLGRVIWSSSVHMTNEQKTDILSHSKPTTVKTMMQFLGLVTYSKNFVPNFSGLVAPLRALITQAGYKNYKSPLQWTVEADKAFVDVKTALSAVCSLHAPNYSEPFHLDVDEKDGYVNAVLYQKGESRTTLDRKVLMYYSSKLDNVEIGHPTCVRHVAAIEKAVQKTSHITMSNQTIVHTTHGVKAFLDSNSFTLSAHKIQGLQQLLDKPYIHFSYTGANMASQMDTTQDHDCVAETNKEMQLHSTLHKEPIQNAQMILYCDGHSHHAQTGTLVTSYAVVEDTSCGLKTLGSTSLMKNYEKWKRCLDLDTSLVRSIIQLHKD